MANVPRDVDPAEAERMVAEGRVVVLDVRTPQEYEGLGHIPAAILIPVDLIASAPATLSDRSRPVLVYCEHGMRSLQAAAFLLRAGFEDVRNLAGGLCRWTGPRDYGRGRISGAASWLLENADLLPRGARTLDVACGSGRHALLLAAAGFPVTAVDRDQGHIAALRATSERLGIPLAAEVKDLEAGPIDLGEGVYELVLVFHYLYRPLFPALVRALAPGGLLIYETFTTAQAARGEPKNPAFLLEPGELSGLVAPLTVLRQREGEFEGRMVAGVVAGAVARDRVD